MVQDSYGKEYSVIYDKFRETENKDGYLLAGIRLLVWFSVFGYRKEHGPFLDLGCGTGSDSLFLAEQGFEGVGVDIAHSMLNVGRRKAEEKGLTALRFINKDITRLSLDKQFGCIFSFGAFVHLTDMQQVRSALRRCWESLKPGGTLIIESAYHSWFLDACKGMRRTYPGFIWNTRGSCNNKKRTVFLEYDFTFNDGRQLKVPMRLRSHAPEELECAIKDAGFTAISTYDADIKRVQCVNGIINQVQLDKVSASTHNIIYGARKP
jgi:ubiquinone/menaquinone biosynthesis C-methylase UbiE